MKIAYLNCASGISGDMLLAALVDSGVSITRLNNELAALKLPGIGLASRRVRRGHISAVQIRVRSPGRTRLDDMGRVRNVLSRSGFSAGIKTRAGEVFDALAAAEARVHRDPMHRVHFHQLGDIDTIVDIVGCVVALEMLGITRIYASPAVVGTGRVTCGSDVFPVPAPAVLELLRGRTLRFEPGVDQETVTPTGAALLRVLTEETSDGLPLQIERTGYGTGTRNFANLPNVLAVMTGRPLRAPQTEDICLIEATIDDTLPLAFQSIFESLMAAGARDVCTVAVMMKKQRPGVMMQVMAPPSRQEQVLAVLFKETTTLGARVQRVQRRVLERKILKLKSEYGIMIDVKLGMFEDEIITVSPEYEHCRAIARRKKVPFKTVYERIKAQALQEVGK